MIRLEQVGQIQGMREQVGRVYGVDGLCPTLTTMGGGNLQPKIMEKLKIPQATKKRTDYGKAIRKDYDSGRVKEKLGNMTALEPREDGQSNTLTTVQKDNLLCEPLGIDEQNRVFRTDGTVGTLTTDGSSPKHNNRVLERNYRIRKLTERECWRLMGFSDEDFDKAAKVNSGTQLYKQAGNSIVVNVLMEIFGRML